ncbi:MAG: acyl-[acyl-carrier-protein] thioesterase [Oscillospiraceae bacterium]
MYYTAIKKVNYYDCDELNRLKISAAIRYMQQTSGEQLDSLGMTFQKLYRENMVFLLSKTCAKVYRMPEAGSEAIVGTAAVQCKGPRFYREFTMETMEGERLISALTLWILVDPATRRILRPSSFPYALPFSQPRLEGEIGDVKLPRMAEDMAYSQSHVDIQYSHIDNNGHVNNSYYADFVCNTIPYKDLLRRGIDTMVLSYQNEAVVGDRLELVQHRLGDTEYYLNGTHGGKPCFEAMLRLN